MRHAFFICLFNPLCIYVCLCSVAVAAGGGEREAGAPAPGEEGDGADGTAAGEGRVPRVLRRQGGAVRGEAGAQVPDVVRGWLPGGQDAPGRPLPPADHRAGGRRPLPLPGALPQALQLLSVTPAAAYAFLPTPRLRLQSQSQVSFLLILTEDSEGEDAYAVHVLCIGTRRHSYVT
jgi:hypothetical protein